MTQRAPKSEEPRVTVLLPVYNGARFLREAIESILEQTFQRFELLIVDDGSTDDSPRIVGMFDDPRIRLVRNEANHGLPVSLNRGLRAARGEYVARQDADDVSLPTRLARQLEYLEVHRSVDLLGTGYELIDDDGMLLGRRTVPVDALRLRWALLFYCPFVHASVMFRRDAVLDAGGYDERFGYAQDYDLWARLARDRIVAAVPETLVRYRRSRYGLTATHPDAQQEMHRIVAAAVRALYDGGEPPRLDDRRILALYDVQFGDAARDRALDVAWAAATVPRLHRRFAARYDLPARARLRHRLEVVGRVAPRLARRAWRAGR